MSEPRYRSRNGQIFDHQAPNMVSGIRRLTPTLARQRLNEQEQRIAELSNPWVSVSDRLPVENLDVLVRTAKGVRVAYYDEAESREGIGWWEAYQHHALYVTHWMPIPTPADVEGEKR